MSVSRDELLRPTLASGAIAKAPHTVRTAFLAAFFGGPLGAIAITAVNSVRLRRLGRDLAPLALALTAFAAFKLAGVYTDWGRAFVAGLTELGGGPRTLSYFDRLIGLALFGLGYAIHRKEQRSADFMGLERPNGWIAGLACIGLAIALTVAFYAATGGGSQQP